ncbi:LysR family transcriptional regulator [Caballeronia sp. M23-90]
MNLTFRQLKVFVKLYELQSFTATAQALHMTQSAVSKLCSEMEEEVGFPLFERTTRSFEPKDGADDLYGFALELLGTLDAAARSLSDLTSIRKGTVSIAAAPMIVYSLLCDAIGEYRRLYPGVRIEIHEISTNLAIEYVVNGKVDFAVVAIDEKHEKLLVEPVYLDKLCLACHPSHSLAGGGAVTWASIAEENLIMLRVDNNMGRVVQQIMTKENLEFEPMIEAGALTSLLGLVRAGVGVAVVPEYAAKYSKDFGIKTVPIRPGKKHSRTLSLIRRSNARSSTAASKFIQILKESLPKIDNQA